ncbi:MAG: multiheme c-type cytochrome [Nitrospirota bacterium]
MIRVRRRVYIGLALLACVCAVSAVSCVREPSVVQTDAAGEKAAKAPKFKGEGGKFTDPKLCGECHSTQYSQWIGSMHHYSQASLTNELVNDFLHKKTGKTISAFCIQCHTPIGTVIGERYDLPNKERSPISLAGVSCEVCHSMNKSHGQAQAFFELKPSNKVYGPHGKGGEKDPPPAKSDFHETEQQDVFKSSQLCQQCHEVIVPNGLRLQETYTEWKLSPWAKEGVTCQSCHMGPVPGKPSERPVGEIAQVAGVELPKRPLSDHSFTGVDYHWTDDYPFRGKGGVAPDDRTKKRNVKIQADLAKKRQELMRNAAKLHVSGPASLAPGSKASLAVRIENTFTGHHFPGGFPWRQAWVEVKYTDAKGNVFFQSGDLDSDGDLRNQFSKDVNAGKVKEDRHLVNLQAQATVRGFRGNDVELPFPLAEEDAPSPTVFPSVGPQSVYNGADNARIIKRGIPARDSRTFSYPIRVPEGMSGPVTYSVRLLYRNYPPYYFDYFARYYTDLKGLLDTLKTKLEIYEVDAVIGKIELGGR